MICKLCNKEKELVNSHIIPKFFFKYLYPDNKIEGESLFLIGGPQKVGLKSRIGPYEKLLCGDCDNIIGRYDNYAKNIFIDGKPSLYPGSDKAFLFNNIKYKELRLFFISLLYRASVSSLDFFSKINVGLFEKDLCKMLINQDPGFPEDFPFFISKHDAGRLGQIAEKNIQDPVKIKTDEGINFSLFFLPNCYRIDIKVDKRPLPQPFDKIILKNNNQLIVLRMGEYEESDNFKALINTI